MILTVDRDLDNPVYGISWMRWYPKNDGNDYNETSIFNFNPKDVKFVYTDHEAQYSDIDAIILIFCDDSRLEVHVTEYDYEMNFKLAEKLVNDIFKMKMLGTKWEEEHPEKYI